MGGGRAVEHSDQEPGVEIRPIWVQVLTCSLTVWVTLAKFLVCEVRLLIVPLGLSGEMYKVLSKVPSTE